MSCCSCQGFPAWSPLSAGEFRGVMTDLLNRLSTVEQTLLQMGIKMAASQSDIDALTQAVNDLAAAVSADDAALKTAVAGIQAELDALKAQGVDVSAAQAAVVAAQSAVADLGESVGSVSALVPPATA